MARTVTLANLRTWARQLANVEGDPNITDAELTSLANRHITEVYDLLVSAGPADYYAASTTISVVAGTSTYALPADFRNLTGVYVNESSAERRPVPPMGENERGRYKPPTTGATVTLEYIPSATVLASDGDTFDGVSGWEELVVNLMARDVMAKREADPSVPMMNIDRLVGRITAQSRARDRGQPKRVVDLDAATTTTWPWGWTTNSRVAVYRLRAANIELYESLWGMP